MTSQLRDYLAYAEEKNLQYTLYVRESTYLSKPVRDLVDSGRITLIRNLGA